MAGLVLAGLLAAGGFFVIRGSGADDEPSVTLGGYSRLPARGVNVTGSLFPDHHDRFVVAFRPGATVHVEDSVFRGATS